MDKAFGVLIFSAIFSGVVFSGEAGNAETDGPDHTPLNAVFSAELSKAILLAFPDLPPLFDNNLNVLVSDLDLDGLADAIVRVEGPWYCGSGGCQTEVFLQRGTGFQQAASYFGAELHIGAPGDRGARELWTAGPAIKSVPAIVQGLPDGTQLAQDVRLYLGLDFDRYSPVRFHATVTLSEPGSAPRFLSSTEIAPITDLCEFEGPSPLMFYWTWKAPVTNSRLDAGWHYIHPTSEPGWYAVIDTDPRFLLGYVKSEAGACRPEDRERVERDFQAAKSIGTAEAYAAFLKYYPDGPIADRARRRVEMLTGQ